MCSAERRLVTRDPADAVAALQAGRLAVLPTETVYGLGADARAPHAVARVYAVKGRPADHPLIVHLGSVDQLTQWVTSVPTYARRLADACWPGPLTLVLPRLPAVGDEVTGGQDTVAVRVPDHPLTLAVLRQVEGVAAPSANRFGRVSPTSAGHVVAELGEALLPGHDVVLDGGPCRVGVESTIVDATGPAPRILRPGGVDAATVLEVAGVPLATTGRAAPRVPGTLASHYAPRASVHLVTADDLAAFAGSPDSDDPDTGVLAVAAIPTPPGTVRLSAPEDASAYARALYAALREADVLALSTVLAVPPTGDGLAVAVRDRLTRAATR